MEKHLEGINMPIQIIKNMRDAKDLPKFKIEPDTIRFDKV